MRNFTKKTMIQQLYNKNKDLRLQLAHARFKIIKLKKQLNMKLSNKEKELEK